MALAVSICALLLWTLRQRQAFKTANHPTPPSSAEAFTRTYLEVAAGKPLHQRRSCEACHDDSDGWPKADWKFFEARAQLTPAAWASAIQIEARCGSCHVTPDPRTLPWQSWNESIQGMNEIMTQKGIPPLTPEERRDIVHYYYTHSFDPMPSLEPDPDPAKSPLPFEWSVLGTGLDTNAVERPFIGHLRVTDLDNDFKPDVLVCDSDNSSLNWIRETDQNGARGWVEKRIAKLPSPARTDLFTNKETARLDIVVACQEQITPTDELTGSVVLLRNLGNGSFLPETILTNISRIASVEPGDFNNDGEVDFSVAAFGHINAGEVGVLEGRKGKYSYRTVLKRSGAIRVQPTDLDQNGWTDFVALFGQEHEQISAFLNNGGSFREVILFKAATPSFGSASIELVDLDHDSDLDILYTNGDNMDLKTRIPRPYHGVQWLENCGALNFVFHEIARLYGAYGIAPADLNRDGHLDIVVTSLFNDWNDPTRASLIWLQNDGHQKFSAHTIARQPIQLISAAVADFNNDTWPDVIASGMHIFAPLDRRGRISLWTRTVAK